MLKDKVVIAIIFTVVFCAIVLGSFLAYKTYREPMYVENIGDTVKMLKNDYNDETMRMYRLSMFYELCRSYKMKDRHTNEIRKFTKEEMNEIYECIGGKEAVLNYLSSIEDKEERRKELELACYQLKIITDDDLVKLWK